jgi:(carboxyethyl)arginine beta-lactam-synthase
METAPNVVGFAAQFSVRPQHPLWPAAPGFLHRGELGRLDWRGARATLTGWAVRGDQQPAELAQDGDCCVLLAGELYHTERLVDLIGENPAGDAALLLSLWQRYGASAGRLLNGRFAAVVVAGSLLTVVTDHAGGVPVFLARTSDGVAVSTEAKTLAGRLPELPPLAVAGSTRSLTGLPAVSQLRGATLLEIDLDASDAAVRGRTTWIAPEHRDLLDPAVVPGRLRTALSAAVQARTGEHNTLVLSGGIDSSSVAALAHGGGAGIETLSLGTDAGNEYDAARLVAEHLGTRHFEIFESSETVVGRLPWTIAAAEITDPEVVEYLLPLVSLYQLLDGPPRRILTGYGADIPLGGMYRTVRELAELDDLIVSDLAGVDGLNEMSPVLGGLAGHWTTHPFWDRDVLDVLLRTEPGLKRRGELDKWVLREAVRDRLPAETVNRPKLGVHEGSGTTSTWTLLLEKLGAPADRVAVLKRRVCEDIYHQVVVEAVAPEQVRTVEVMQNCIRSIQSGNSKEGGR